ncbi:MAG: hypothetical protein DDT33_00917 [Firmicutes bacterium]|nr:hypothetical protein [Bacillota bacterium]
MYSQNGRICELGSDEDGLVKCCLAILTLEIPVRELIKALGIVS